MRRSKMNKPDDKNEDLIEEARFAPTPPAFYSNSR